VVEAISESTEDVNEVIVENELVTVTVVDSDATALRPS